MGGATIADYGMMAGFICSDFCSGVLVLYCQEKSSNLAHKLKQIPPLLVIH
ncbi:hypothetical protein SPONN_632 [uncultured Candidatus Thioglobus sp.]|nr:hypothetical protein SPONN_632 [uncultured Candidatus Thioglobus sp.]